MSEDLKVKVFSFLKNQQLAVVATSSKDCIPDAAVIEYLVDDNWNLYFLTHEDTNKIKNLNENNKIAVVVGTVLSPNTLQIEGETEIIKSGTDHFEEILISFGHDQMIFNTPLLKFRKLNLVMVKVKIIKMRWLDYNPELNKEEYAKIIP